MDRLVTVFGASGFVGNNVVRLLARAGWRIRAAVRNPHLERAEGLRVHGVVGQIDVMAANIRKPESVHAALDGAEAVVNCVGVLFERGRQRFTALHAQGAKNLAQAAADYGIEQLVHISAIGADPTSASRYARSKAEGEAAVLAATPSATILRPSVVFGQEDQFFNRFGAMAAVAPALPLIGGGRTRFQPVYVGDVARAVVAALGDASARGRTYELGGPKIYTFREVLELVLRETGRSRPLLPLPFFAARAIGTVADVFTPILPFDPPLTRDQVELLRRDNVADPALPGLQALGITPTAPEGIIDSYLYRYRKAGQFSTITPDKSASAGDASPSRA
ncbi:MAG: complex I NDUFA9 subunit family protein [Pseudomonadota bacterium]|nr:complex I NDUFA9 subunit family protein [Pseudomonadota bacterium]